jgi:hypothetical protein
MVNGPMIGDSPGATGNPNASRLICSLACISEADTVGSRPLQADHLAASADLTRCSPRTAARLCVSPLASASCSESRTPPGSATAPDGTPPISADDPSAAATLAGDRIERPMPLSRIVSGGAVWAEACEASAASASAAQPMRPGRELPIMGCYSSSRARPRHGACSAGRQRGRSTCWQETENPPS